MAKYIFVLMQIELGSQQVIQITGLNGCSDGNDARFERVLKDDFVFTYAMFFSFVFAAFDVNVNLSVIDGTVVFKTVQVNRQLLALTMPTISRSSETATKRGSAVPCACEQLLHGRDPHRQWPWD